MIINRNNKIHKIIVKEDSNLVFLMKTKIIAVVYKLLLKMIFLDLEINNNKNKINKNNNNKATIS